MSSKRYRSLSAFFEQTGTTHAHVARALGVSQSAVSLWRKGRRFPQSQTALRLAKLTGVPLEVLLGAKRTRVA